MTEPVQLFQRASGTWVLGCSVNLARHVYAPLAKPQEAGLSLWCRDCKDEHNMPWLALLACMERFVGREAFAQILAAALAAVPAARTVTWRAEE